MPPAFTTPSNLVNETKNSKETTDSSSKTEFILKAGLAQNLKVIAYIISIFPINSVD